jgi:hypothetical protein
LFALLWPWPPVAETKHQVHETVAGSNPVGRAIGVGSIRGARGQRPYDSDGMEERCTQALRKYSADAERVDELMHRVDERFAPRLEKMPGFVAYQAIDAGVDRAGEGTVFAVTICSDRGAADRFAGIASEFVRDELGEMEVARLGAATGAVSVNRHVRGARGGSLLATC